MMLRKLVTPIAALGLTGAAVYYSPCLTGDCGEEAAVADADDTPCDGHADKGALAAGGDEEPCPYAAGDKPCDQPCDGKKKAADSPDPSALAAAGDEEEPCPFAAGKKDGDEPCHGKKKAGDSTLAAAEPQPAPEPTAEPAPADGSRS
jgi:hypothetical protein